MLAMVAAFFAAVARRAGRSAAEVRKSVADMIADCICDIIDTASGVWLRFNMVVSWLGKLLAQDRRHIHTTDSDRDYSGFRSRQHAATTTSFANDHSRNFYITTQASLSKSPVSPIGNVIL